MGRIVRQTLAFVLGFIIGLCSIAGTCVGVSFYTYKKMSISRMEDLTGVDLGYDYLGKLEDMTIEESINFTIDVMQNPQKYSVKELEEKYDFDFEKLLSNWGIELKNDTPQEKENVEALKELNIALLLSGNLSGFLDTISASSLFNFLPDSILSDGTRARIANYSLKELFEEDAVTGNFGIIDALSQVKFGGLFPQFYDEVYNPNAHVYTYEYVAKDQEWLNLLGNLNFGSLLNSFFTKESDIITELMSGRLTDLSDKPIREIFGDVGSAFGEDTADILEQVLGVFGDSAITDWFILAEDGVSYEFSIDSMLKEVKIGYAMGYEYGEVIAGSGTLDWYTQDEAGNKTAVDGLRKVIADINVYGIYQSILSNTVVDEILAQLGTVSVGGILEEFIGYEYDEATDTWNADEGLIKDAHGEALDVLTAFAGVSVSGIFNGSDDILANVLNCLRDSVSGYKIGDFVADFAPFTENSEGKWLDNNGEEILSALNGLFSIELDDLILEEFSLEEVILILKEAVGECSVGEIVGATYNGTNWEQNGSAVSEMLDFVYGIKFRNVLDVFLTDFGMTEIVRAVFGDTTVGDLLIAFANFDYDEASGIFYNFNGEETVPALYTLREVEVWQLVAGFDKSSGYDIIPLLKQIRVGDFVGQSSSARAINVTWTLNNFAIKDIKITGAANEILSINIGDIFDPAITAEQILEPVKNCSVGEVVQSALGMYVESEEWTSTYLPSIFDFMGVLAEIPTTINGIIDFANGSSGETIEEFLEGMLGGVGVGDLIGDLLGYSYDATTSTWNADNGTDPSYKLFEVLFNYEVITDTFKVINSDDIMETIKGIVGDIELGHFAEPFAGMEKISDDNELVWAMGGEKVLTLLSDVLAIRVDYILTIVDDVIDGKGIKASEVVDAVCGQTRTLGDYLDEIIPETNLKPINQNLYGIVIYDFVSIVIENALGDDAREQYVKDTLDDIEVGHFVEPFMGLTLTVDGWDYSEGGLQTLLSDLFGIRLYWVYELVMDIVGGESISASAIVGEICTETRTLGDYLTDFIGNTEITPIDKNLYGIVLYDFVAVIVEGKYGVYGEKNYTSREDYLEQNFGDIEVGHFVEIFDGALKQEAGVWTKEGGLELLFSDLYGIAIYGTVMGVIDAVENGKFAPLVGEILGETRTVGDYVSDFTTEYPNILDISVNRISPYELVAVVVDQNYGTYNGNTFNNLEDYLEYVLGDVEVGHIVEIFDGSLVNNGTAWNNTSGNLELLFSDLYGIALYGTVMSVIDAVENGKFAPVVEEIFGRDRTVGLYLQDFTTDYPGILDVSVNKINPYELVSIVVDQNYGTYASGTYADLDSYLESMFNEVTAGHIVEIFDSSISYDGATWSGADLKILLQDLYNVKLYGLVTKIIDSVEVGKYAEIADYVFGQDRIVGDYVADFTTDYPAILDASVNKINPYELVSVVVDQNYGTYNGNTFNSLEDYLEYVFGSVEVGHIVEIFDGSLVNNGTAWNNTSNDLETLFVDLYGIGIYSIVNTVIDSVKNGKYAPIAEEIFGQNRVVGDYVSDFTTDYPAILDASVNKINPYELVSIVVDKAYGTYASGTYADLDSYLESMFNEVTAGHIVEIFDSSISYDGATWSGADLKLILRDLYNIKLYGLVTEIIDSVEAGKYAGIADYVFGQDRVVGDYVADFTTDYPAILDASVNKINPYEFVSIVVDKAYGTYASGTYTDLDTYLEYVLGEVEVGHIVQSFDDTLVQNDTALILTGEVKNGGNKEWNNANGDLQTLLKDAYGINFFEVYKFVDNSIANGFKTSALIELICTQKRTVGDYVLDFIDVDINLLKTTVFAINIYEAIAILVENDTSVTITGTYTDRLDYVAGIFEGVEVGHVVEIFDTSITNDGTSWTKEGGLEQLFVDVYGISIWGLVETTINAITKKDGVAYADIALQLTSEDNTRTIGDWVKPFIPQEIELLDITAYGINLYEMVNVLVDGNLGAYEDRVDYLVSIIEPVEVGHVVKLFNEKLLLQGETWTENGETIKPLFSDLYGTSVWGVIDTTINAVTKKNGTLYADIVLQLTSGSLTRTVGDWVKPFASRDLPILDTSVYAINLYEFVNVLADANFTNYADRTEYLKSVLGGVEIGHIVQIFDANLETNSGVWTNGGKDLELILSDVYGASVYGLVDTTIKAVTGKDGVKYADITLQLTDNESRVLGDYLDGLINRELLILNDSVYSLNIYEFVNVLADGEFGVYESKVDYLLSFVENVQVGHVVQIFMQELNNGSGVWKQGEKDLKLILSDLYSVSIYGVVDSVIKFVNKEGEISDISLQILPMDKTVGDYMADILTNPNAALVETVYKINAYEAIRVLAEKAFTQEFEGGRTYASEIDYLMYIFGDLEIGHFFQNAQNLAKDDNGAWYKVDGELNSALAGVYSIKPIIIVGLAYYLIMGEPIAPLISEYMPEANTIGDLFGDLGFKFAPLTDYTFNLALYDFVDAVVDGNYANYECDSRVDYLKKVYNDLRVGHFVQDAVKVERVVDGWYAEGDTNRPVFRVLNSSYEIRIMYIVDFIVDAVKTKQFKYDTLYGDTFGTTTNIGYYVTEFFGQSYNEEYGVYVDKNGEIIFNAISVLYNIVPYDYLVDAKANGFANASKNLVGSILIGDLINDIISSKLPKAGITAELENGVYVNNGEWANLFDTVYNISVREIIDNIKTPQYFKDKFFNLLIGDYVGSLAEKLLKGLGKQTEVNYSKAENLYVVDNELSKVIQTLSNISIQGVLDGIKSCEVVDETGEVQSGAFEFITDDWFGDIYIGDLYNWGLCHYDSSADLWYNGEEVIPFDFDLLSTVIKKCLGLSVYKLTHKFDYMSLLEDLYLGNTMALTRYMELQAGSEPVIYADAGRYYTLDSEGNEVKFPYEIGVLNGEFYYTIDGETAIMLTVNKNVWYETKLFEHQFGVEITKDESGNYVVSTVADESLGEVSVVYPCEYVALTDNYKVTINAEEQYFRVYNGVFYWAEKNGDFKRFSQNFIVQKLSDIQLTSLLSGFNIEKELGQYYLGEVMGRVKGELVDPAGSLSYRKDATYRWFKDEALTEELTGIDYVISNIVLGRIFDGTIDFASEIQELTVKDVFADAEKVGILKLFADTKLGDLEQKFNDLMVGEIMEYTQSNEIYKDTQGNYVFPTSIVGVNYSNYVRKNDVNYPVTIQNDGTTDYYELEGTRYDLTRQTGIWVTDNDIISEGYEIEDNKVYDIDGVYLGTIEFVSGDAYRTISATDSTLPIAGIETIANRNGSWHRIYAQDGETVVDVATALVAVFADLKVSDFAGSDFVDLITTKVKNELTVGEFFTPSNSGVFSLFSAEELNNILIKDFSQACTTKIKTTSIYDFATAKLIDGVLDTNGNPDGMFSLFTVDELKTITIANVSTSIANKVETATVGQLLDAGLVVVSEANQVKLNNIVPNWRDETVDEVLTDILNNIGA